LHFKSTASVDSFEGCDSHDEVINKLGRYGKKSSIDISIPFIIHYIVSLRRLNIVSIENYFAKVGIGHLNVYLKGNVPHIGVAADNLRIDVKFDRIGICALDPETGHEKNNFIS
jgi:hypothetical protein